MELSSEKVFVVQYKMKRRGSDWKDYSYYKTLEQACRAWDYAQRIDDLYWMTRYARVISRYSEEQLIHSSEPLTTDD